MQQPDNNQQNDSGCISGLAIQANPENIDQVVKDLTQLDGVEVHIVDPSGKLVITIEENAGEKIMVDTITRISQLDGVISTNLAYTHHAA